MARMDEATVAEREKHGAKQRPAQLQSQYSAASKIGACETDRTHGHVDHFAGQERVEAERAEDRIDCAIREVTVLIAERIPDRIEEVCLRPNGEAAKHIVPVLLDRNLNHPVEAIREQSCKAVSDLVSKKNRYC